MSKRKREVKEQDASEPSGAGKKFKSSYGENMEILKHDDTISVDFEDLQRSAEEEAVAPTVDWDAKRARKTQRKKLGDAQAAEGGKRTTNSKKKAAWTVSDAVGGHILDLDPLFSFDEQYLLIAYQSSIKVYSASTSHWVRSLKIGIKGIINDFALSAVNPSLLYLSHTSGRIEEWDWTDGTRKGTWHIKSQIFNLALTQITSDDTQAETIYTIDGALASKRWMITAHRLRGGSETELHTLYRSSTPLAHLKILDRGRVIIASSGQKVVIGRLRLRNLSALKDMSFTWHEFDCTESITCLDAIIEKDKSVPKATKSSSHPASKSPVHLVVGGVKGVIFAYEDILGKLDRIANQKLSHGPGPRRFHWHRNAVGAVKWSTEGNYIISGGSETVLVLWQTDTGRQQNLPHLSAAIENVNLSPSGSLYAIRLADNSAMVLSTQDLEPTMRVTGIQLHVSKVHQRLFDVPRMPSGKGLEPLLRRPAIIPSASTSGQLLLAVPATSSARNTTISSASSNYLQTFDLRSGDNIARQALTRTNITDLITGPEGNVIDEPNVVLLCLSHNGKWLATIDEWFPPRRDLKSGSINMEGTEILQRAQVEVYLKFWLWNDDSKIWELVTRVDVPHSTRNAFPNTSGRIFDIAHDPARDGFVTIGDDGISRIWRPRIRSRDGVELRGKDAKAMTSWVCQHSTPSPDLEWNGSRSADVRNARLAVSTDGSLLLVGYQSNSTSALHTIDIATGKICSILPELIKGKLIGLGLVGRFLIVLSDELIVWDIVDSIVSYGISMVTITGKSAETGGTHLATDEKNQTFAVGIPRNSGSSSQVVVFDPTNFIPLFSTEVPHILKALLPDPGSKSYFVVDSFAEARTLAKKTTFHAIPDVPEKEHPVSSAGLENIYGNGKSILASNGTNLDNKTHTTTPSISDDNVVVHQHQLTDLFDTAQPFTLPPIINLFEQVASLFSRKATSVS